MAVLRASKVREVHVIGRRGPAQAKFTTKELRELGELPGVQVSVDPAELDLEAGFDALRRVRRARRVRPPGARQPGRHDGLGEPPADPADTAGRQLRMRFWLRPVEIEESSSGTVGGLRLERTRISESGQFEGTGEFETIEAQLVLRSVGYQSVPLAGVPFDARSCTVPNSHGRVLSEAGEPLPGEYVAGWLKRGPTGVIGTNKARRGGDRPGAARGPGRRPGRGRGHAAASRPAAPARRGPGHPRRPRRARARRGARGARRGPVSYADWLRISAAEEELAASLGRGDRVKLPHSDALWTAAGRERRA